MKQLTCEMCGSTDLLKEGGVFVCQTCGCKYSVEEAKKMMAEGTVQVASTVKPDNIEQIKNFLKIANNAYDAGNHKEAEEYSNKIIEIDPENAEGWLIKGKAAGWQSTGYNDRVEESISAWTYALMYVPEDSRTSMVATIVGELTGLAMASVTMRCNNFANYCSEDNLNSIKNTVDKLLEQIDTMFSVAKFDVDQSTFKNLFAKQMNGAAVEGSNASDKNFGPDDSDRSRYAWNRYTEEQDLCLSLLSKAYDICDNEDTCLTICENYIAIAKNVRDSCSYTFEPGGAYGVSRYVRDYSFTTEAKKSRTETIDNWEKKRDSFDPKLRKASAERIKKLITTERKKKQIEAGKTKYWEEHVEEKVALEKEKSELTRRIESIGQQKLDNLERKELNKINENIVEKKKEMSSLGLFKGKEKKAIQAEIDELSKQASTLSSRVKIIDDGYDAEIATVDSRIQEINREFSKSRGEINLDVHPEQFVIYAEDGTYLITGHQLFEYVRSLYAGDYHVGTGTEDDEKIFNATKAAFEVAKSLNNLMAAFGIGKEDNSEYVDDPNAIKLYRIPIYDYRDKSKIEQSGVSVSYSAYSEEGVITRKIQIESNDDSKKDESIKLFINLATSFIYGLTKDATIDEIHEYLISGAYGLLEDKEIIMDDLKLRIKTKDNIVVYISKA